MDFDFIERLAKALGQQFGSNCEIVVHDLNSGDPEHTITAIENGHVSNRKIGDGPSRIVLEALKEGGEEVRDQYAYLTKTGDGRILRSSTIYIRDKKGKPTGIFSINYDITNLVLAQSTISGLVDVPPVSNAPERIPTNVNELLDDLIEQSIEYAGKPVALMTKDDKIKAIRFLDDAGAMLITKSGDKISKYFGISKYTLYSYLDAK